MRRVWGEDNKPGGHPEDCLKAVQISLCPVRTGRTHRGPFLNHKVKTKKEIKARALDDHQITYCIKAVRPDDPQGERARRRVRHIGKHPGEDVSGKHCCASGELGLLVQLGMLLYCAVCSVWAEQRGDVLRDYLHIILSLPNLGSFLIPHKLTFSIINYKSPPRLMLSRS